jgi:hypothetical protein
MLPHMPSIKLRAFEAALAEVGIRSLRLESGAAVSKLKWLQSQLGVLLPPSVQTLLAWHNGESDGARLFHALVVHEVEARWREVYPDLAPGVSFLSVSKIASVGALRVSVDESETLSAWKDAAEAPFHVIPFVRLATQEPREHWYIGVDSCFERVWLCAYDVSGVPIFDRQADSIGAWFETLLAKLLAPGREHLLRELIPSPRVRNAKRSTTDARALLNMLIAEQAIELEAGAEVALELQVLKQLAKRPRADAVRGIVTLLSEDAGVAEIYATDDALRRMINGFVP